MSHSSCESMCGLRARLRPWKLCQKSECVKKTLTQFSQYLYIYSGNSLVPKAGQFDESKRSDYTKQLDPSSNNNINYWEIFWGRVFLMFAEGSLERTSVKFELGCENRELDRRTNSLGKKRESFHCTIGVLSQRGKNVYNTMRGKKWR